MGKPYNFNYIFAPTRDSAGTMLCGTCRKPIDNQSEDWCHYTKPSKHNWAYVCHHRKCYTGHDGWASIEKREYFNRIRASQFCDAAEAFRQTWSGELDRFLEGDFADAISTAREFSHPGTDEVVA